jgi:hypothetical protein
MKRRSLRRTALTLLVLALLASATSGCGLFFPLVAGGPYRGRVVDAETKAPLEGAVVLAVWENEIPGVSGPGQAYLDSEEVLTDRDGRFVVGEHPPISFFPSWVTGPRISIFYPGYGSFPLYQTSPQMPPRGIPGLLEMMEKEELVIELPRLTTREERLKVIDGAFFDDIPHEKVPSLVRAINIERRALGLPKTYLDNAKERKETYECS